MSESQVLLQHLRELEEKRKNGEIGVVEFYKGLLEILGQLKDALVHENISENDIKKQIPLLLAFIKSQITEMEHRGH
ncbi:MAG: hypothetical protein GXN97_02565 [Aquificae bacterium]|jgi:hypothetical protein|nr:hypothetical protein [Aquificota bacterium]